MDIDNRLYVIIEPFDGPHAPMPHPIRDARFDAGRVYKVLGMYNASESSEAFFVLSNPENEIWFISNRHLRAAGLSDAKNLSFDKPAWERLQTGSDTLPTSAVAALGGGTSVSLHRAPR